MRTLLRFRHWMNENTKRKARKNISAHYDLATPSIRSGWTRR